MTYATRCDQCQTIGSNPLDTDDLPYGWFELIPNRVLRAIGESKEYHFCSWQCLHTFAADRVTPNNDSVDATR